MKMLCNTCRRAITIWDFLCCQFKALLKEEQASGISGIVCKLPPVCISQPDFFLVWGTIQGRYWKCYS